MKKKIILYAYFIHVFMRSAFHKMSAQDTIYSNGTGQFQTSKNLKSSKFDHILVPTTNFEGYSISTSVEKKKKKNCLMHGPRLARART